MATSGTRTFNPAIGEFVASAFARCGLRRTMLVQEHFADARMELNLMLSSASNIQPNLWQIDLVTVPMLEGVAAYTLSIETQLILDAYRSYTTGGVTTDIYMTPISRTDYASFPDKTQQGQPTIYWFDRTITPTVYLWQVPDATGVYDFKFYRVRQNEDAYLDGGQTLSAPYRFYDAFVAGLAARLAVIYAPDRAAMLQGMADRAWKEAREQDEEMAPIYISPQLGGYWR